MDLILRIMEFLFDCFLNRFRLFNEGFYQCRGGI